MTDAFNKPPIFILGCQRSGTSLLRRIIDSHSNIACPPESAFIVQLAKIFEIKRALQGILYMGFTEADVLKQMRIFTSHFFEKYVLSKKKVRWADKTTHYVNHMDTIDHMFNGQILYLGIIRNGMDVAYSLSQFDWSILDPYMADGTDRLLAAALFWKDQNQKLLDFSKRVQDRFHLIKYEDLVSSPESIVKAVFDFIDEPWEPEVLDFQSFQHDKGFEDPEISKFDRIVDDSGLYQKLDTADQRRLYDEIREPLESIGYYLKL